jgi:N utilization substance protein B
VVAVQALYESDVSGHPAVRALERRAADAGLKARAARFAVELVARVEANRREFDATIGRAAPAWPVEQLAAVDRAILRLALAELAMGPGTPPGVVADEAVELAKLLSSESSPRFINGVLGTVLG